MPSLYQEAIDAVRGLLETAQTSGEPEPTAMTLATAGIDGRVSARIVLLKHVDADGFCFFTNYDSAKAHVLEENSNAALCLLWKAIGQIVQVRVEGVVRKGSADESDAYFASRARVSQIGAWASRQSQTLASREELDARVAEFERKFADGDVPRPPHWGGYCLMPEMIELWYGQRARLHDRVRYQIVDGEWTKRLLYP